ncbi:TPM domain-containing protein [soil metagenome]
MVAVSRKALGPADHARISAAIVTAESRTSGEIFCVLAHRVSSYREVSLGWAAAAALVLPMFLIPLNFDPAWFPGIADNWEAVHLAARHLTIGRALSAYAVLQAAVFVVVFLITSVPAIRDRITPLTMRRARVRRAALQQFLAHGLHVTKRRTGVLIFASLAERQVEVIADEGIHALVDDSVWADAVTLLTRAMRDGRPVDGFQSAVTLVGTVLAEHFPPGVGNPDELPNRLVEM